MGVEHGDGYGDVDTAVDKIAGLRVFNDDAEKMNLPLVDVDGQVLVVNDLLGVMEDFSPRFVKRYATIGRDMSRAFTEFVDDVKKGKFPDSEHSYS